MALQIFLSLITTFWVTLFFYSMGEFFRRVTGFTCSTLLEKVVIHTSVGFGLSGTLIMILNILNIVSSTSIILLLAIPSLIFIQRWIKLFQNLKNRVLQLKYSQQNLLFLIPLSLLFFYFLRSLLPPSGFDALMYHLSCAQLYLDHGGFYNIFFNPQSDFPMLTEMNYQIGLAFNNDLICRQLSLLADCLACGSLLLFCRYIQLQLSRNASVVAVSIFLSMPVVIASVSSCDVDLPLAAWIALAVYTLLHSDTTSPAKRFIVPAFLAGMAVSTKIFGIFVFPLLLLIIIYKKNFIIKNIFTLILVPCSMGLPWFIKSILHKGTILSINHSLITTQGLGIPMGVDTQNPVVTFLVNIFFRIAAAPWTFSLIPSQHQKEMLGPLFIALLPFAFLIKLPTQPKILLICSGIYLSCILLMEMLFIPAGASIRYVLVITLFCIPVCLHIVKELKKRSFAFYKIVMLMVALQISFGSILLVKKYHKDWIALLTSKSSTDYYESILLEYPAVNFINNLQSGSKIMTLYNFDNYLIKKPYITAYRHYTNRGDLIEDFRKYGITHIFANNVLDTTVNATVYPELDTKNMVFSKNGFYVFEIKSGGQQ